MLLSDDDEPQLRWRFTDIGADSFVWRADLPTAASSRRLTTRCAPARRAWARTPRNRTRDDRGPTARVAGGRQLLRGAALARRRLVGVGLLPAHRQPGRRRTAARRRCWRSRTSRRGSGWLPDGSLLVVSMKDQRLLRRSPTATVTEHADLSDVCGGHLNDMVVDASGRAFVGDFGFDLMGGARPGVGGAGPGGPGRHGVRRRRGPAVPERLGDHAGRRDADRRRDVGRPVHRLRHRRRRLADQPAGVGAARARAGSARSPRRSASCVRPRRLHARRRGPHLVRRRVGSRARCGRAGRRDRRRDRRRRTGWASTPARSVGTTAARC